MAQCAENRKGRFLLFPKNELQKRSGREIQRREGIDKRLDPLKLGKLKKNTEGDRERALRFVGGLTE